MVPSKETIRLRHSWPWWRLSLAGLSALGLALSAYLGWHFLMGGPVIGCGGGSSCEEVLTSRWSAIGGVLPVSGLAAGTYLAMLMATFFIGPTTPLSDRRLAWSAMLVLVGAAAGSAVWFIIVQKWFIGAFCPYCMATHITGLLLAVLVIWQAPMQFKDNSTNHAKATSASLPERGHGALPRSIATVAAVTSQRASGRLPVLRWVVFGLAIAGIVAICQIAFTPPTVYRAGEFQNYRLAIDPHNAPIVGSPDAGSIVTLLFDYKCSHCQKLHAMLDEVIRSYDGKLAFTLCPAPLNNQCNPYISHEVEQFKDSCELAKIAVAVWFAKRDAFPEFDRWMFSPEPGQPWHARTVDSAKAKAIELVSRETFEKARSDPWIEQFMQTSVRIYGDTINPNQSGNAVPKLVYGSRWVTPEPRNANDLISILHNTLAVPGL